MSSKGTKQERINIVGNENIIGDHNTVTKLTAGTTNEEVIKQAIRVFIDEIQLSENVSTKDKDTATSKAKELEETLNSPNPDLGIIQRFKKFVSEKGGPIATAGLTLLANPSVKALVEAAAKKLFS